MVADGIGCKFCSSLGRPDAETRDQRTTLAVAYAEALCANMGALRDIDDDVFSVLKEEFSEHEIVELTVWILFMVAGSAFGALMQVPAASNEEFDEYRQWRSEGQAQSKGDA